MFGRNNEDKTIKEIISIIKDGLPEFLDKDPDGIKLGEYLKEAGLGYKVLYPAINSDLTMIIGNIVSPDVRTCYIHLPLDGSSNVKNINQKRIDNINQRFVNELGNIRSA